ncbi:MAG TPA: hypothetical protein VGM77_09160 [Gemmatimonadales bacterium]|jgi:hypothetical protein
MYRPSVLLIVVTSLVAAAAAAQTVPTPVPLAPGARVRIITADSGRAADHQIGVLQSVRGDTVRYLRASDSTPGVAMLGSRVRLEQSTGSVAHPAVGLFIGAMVGAVGSIGRPRGDDGGLPAAGGMFAGAVVGFLVGAVLHTDRWEPVQVGEMALDVSASGPGLAIRIHRLDLASRWLPSTGRLSYHPN